MKLAGYGFFPTVILICALGSSSPLNNPPGEIVDFLGPSIVSRSFLRDSTRAPATSRLVGEAGSVTSTSIPDVPVPGTSPLEMDTTHPALLKASTISFAIPAISPSPEYSNRFILWPENCRNLSATRPGAQWGAALLIRR